MPSLTTSDLLTRGYFHDRVIPALNSSGLGSAEADLTAYVRTGPKLRSRCTSHSVPKRKHLRRTPSIPNPISQTALCLEIEKHWRKLETACKRSSISLSVPILSSGRALETASNINTLPVHRSLRSAGARYVLRTDLARFYPSIYTHSVPWALHGKAAARADRSLYGNAIDKGLRETQDKQTGGIPIGPDTSFLIGEVIATAIDVELQAVFKARGVRFIDDYNLYFDTQTDAERALALLHKVAKEFELEVNDPKTEILALPEELEPFWKTELRGLDIRPASSPQATDLISLFNRGFDFAVKFPHDSVLTYVAKQVASSIIDPTNWELCESLLMRAALAEPTALPVIIDVLSANAASMSGRGSIGETVLALCNYHAPLQQGYEVAWALWLAGQQRIPVPPTVARKIVQMDDDIVALVALDLLEKRLFPTVPMRKWRSAMSAQNLYSEHWLLCYEALERGWLPSRADYVAADPGFSILPQHGVRFYDDGSVSLVLSSTGYV